MKTLNLCLLGILFLQMEVSAQDWKIKLDSILTEISIRGLFNGQVLLVEKGIVTFHGAYGYFHKKPIGKNTLLPIASIDKTITAAGLMLLEQEGLLSFEDKITRFLPGLTYKTVTVEHLLNQTSGIPNFLATAMQYGDTTQVMNAEDILNVVTEVQPEGGSPGDKFHYNNSNYFLVRQIIEEVTGTSYADFMKEKVFAAFDMNESQLLFPMQPESVNADNFYQPGGGIFSTVDDLFRFSLSYQDDQVISSENRQRAFSKPVLHDGTASSYGLGWYIFESEDGKSVGHWGGGESIKAYLELYLHEEKSLALLSVDCTPYMDAIYAMIRDIWEGRKYEVPQKVEAYNIDPELFEEYVGSYLLPQMGLLHISTTNGKLYLRPDPIPGKEELVPVSDSTFMFANQDLRWQFYRQNGEVVGFGFQGQPENMGPRQ